MRDWMANNLDKIKKIRNFWNKHSTKIYVALLILVTFFTFYKMLDNYFFLDDFMHVGRAPLMLEFVQNYSSWQLVKDSFLYNFPFSYYRPLTHVLYLTLYSFFGLNPLWYYATMLLFHIINVLLVYVLLNLMLRNKHISFLSALFFGLSPGKSTAVSVLWISVMAYVLATTFFILAMIFFIKYNKEKKLIFLLFTLLAYILTMLLYDGTITLIFVLIAYSLLVNSDRGKLNKESIIGHTTLIITLVSYLVVRFVIYHMILLPIEWYKIGGHMAKNIFNYLIGFYIIPAIDYSSIYFSSPLIASIRELNFYIYMPIVIIFLLVRGSSTTRFFMFWIFLTILPASAFTNGIHPYQTYLSSVGISVLLAMFIFFVYKKIKKINLVFSLSTTFFLIMIIVSSSITFARLHETAIDTKEIAILKNKIINVVKDYPFTQNATLYFENCYDYMGLLPELFLRDIIKREAKLKIEVTCIRFNDEKEDLKDKENLKNAFIILKMSQPLGLIATQQPVLNNTYFYDYGNNTIKKVVDLE